ncbi:hypothetical protein GCM10010222_35420 [Streptomyces tanashiensis]|uniref:hypothetical protein n=1 Tax=Streptomyces tanashiensis TaxID=67367 RepID=UPI00167A5B3F|nr:hypothetical protein [Streptomyces tanashiensis]GGS90723.1 hypothetical protein GCM10010222_35420 [Streptomyces tanashiensis]
MPIVVVAQEKTLAALTTRLLKTRTPKAVKEKAAQAIREANPGLDLVHLRPGMVVVVPRLADLRGGDHDDLVDESLDLFLAQVRGEVDALLEVADAALKDEKAELEQMAKVLDVMEVQQAAQNDPLLQENLQLLRSSIDDDVTAAGDNTDILLNGIEQWYTDIDDLSTLW